MASVCGHTGAPVRHEQTVRLSWNGNWCHGTAFLALNLLCRSHGICRNPHLLDGTQMLGPIHNARHVMECRESNVMTDVNNACHVIG